MTALVDFELSLSTFFFVNQIVVSIYLFFTALSWFGNTIIIIVTIRSKDLHNPCNILIGIQAFTDLFMQGSHFFYAYCAYNEILVTFRTCFYANLPFISAFDFSTMMMLFIALDRFVCVRWAAFYKTINPTFYITGIVLTCLGYCAILKVLSYMSITDELTMCLIAESMTGYVTNIWLGAGAVVNSGVIVCYYMISKQFKDMQTTNQREYNAVNRSLKTLIFVYIFGWFFTTVTGSIALLISPTHRVYTALITTIGISANVNLAAPFFVYYSQSTLYRGAIRKLFGLAKVSGGVGATHAMSSAVTATVH